MKALGYVFSAALVVLGAGMVWEGTRLGYAGYGVPGAGFFPVWSGLLLTVSGIAFALQAASAHRLEDDVAVLRQFLAIAMVAVFLLLNEGIGTLGAILIYLAGSVYFIGRHSLAITALCCIVCLAIVYAVFELWLRIPLVEPAAVNWLMQRLAG